MITIPINRLIACFQKSNYVVAKFSAVYTHTHTHTQTNKQTNKQTDGKHFFGVESIAPGFKNPPVPPSNPLIPPRGEFPPGWEPLL